MSEVSKKIEAFRYDGNLTRLGQMNSEVRNLCEDAVSMKIDAVSSQVLKLRQAWEGRLVGYLKKEHPEE